MGEYLLPRAGHLLMQMEILSQRKRVILRLPFLTNGVVHIQEGSILLPGKFDSITTIGCWRSSHGWQTRNDIFRQSRIGRVRCTLRGLAMEVQQKEMVLFSSLAMPVMCR